MIEYSIGERVLVGDKFMWVYEATNLYTNKKYLALADTPSSNPTLGNSKSFNGALHYYIDGFWGGVRKIRT